MISTIVAASTFAGLAAAAPVANIFATAAESVTTFGPFNATHFYSTEYKGSCGYTNRTNQYIVSIATNKTSESACGKTVNITSQWNGDFVLAQVVDEREDASSSYLNLSRVAFEAVAPISYEYFGATYTFSDKDVPAYVPVPEANGAEPAQPENTPESSSKKDNSPSTWTSTSSSQKAEWTPTTSSEKAEWTPTTSSSKSQWTPSTSSSKKAEYTPEQKQEQPEWTPSSSSKKEQPKQTQQSKPQSSGGQSGSVTYFYQGGNAGACGSVNSDSSYVAALSPSQYSGKCGQSVTITNVANGNTITATVADLCPSCSYGHIDLSVGAFQALGSMSSGVLQTTYHF